MSEGRLRSKLPSLGYWSPHLSPNELFDAFVGHDFISQSASDNAALVFSTKNVECFPGPYPSASIRTGLCLSKSRIWSVQCEEPVALVDRSDRICGPSISVICSYCRISIVF